MVERFANDTEASGRQTDGGIPKLARGLGRIINGTAEPATEGVSHLLKMVFPSVPIFKMI